MSYVEEEMIAKHDDRGAAKAAVGVSLGSDAWRRLRRDPIAMLSLATLVTISVLAFLTPLLPLQPPDQDMTRLQYQPPRISPLFEQIVQHRLGSHSSARPKTCGKCGRSSRQQQRELASLRGVSSTDSNSLADAEKLIERKQNELDDIVQRPYREVGFPTSTPSAAGWFGCGTICSASGRWARSLAATNLAATCCRACSGERGFRSSSASWPRSCRS